MIEIKNSIESRIMFSSIKPID